MKIVFLSRYQNEMNRGAEVFVAEVSKRLSRKYEVFVLGDLDHNFVDVVIPMNGGLQALKASLGRLFKKYKLVIVGQSGVGRTSIFNLALAPDVFVALTDSMFQWAQKWAWATRVVKIPNGVDLQKFKPTGEKIPFDLPGPVILSVGALAWYKHHERVIKAVSKMADVSVLIVGEGPEKERLIKLGSDLLGKRFKIVSFSYQDMPKVYRSADLFTLPSWEREAFGMVYLEAMACGLGVVAPDDQTRHEIIKDAGILTDVSDPQKYAEALGEALKVNWREKALKQASKFSWEKICQMYEAELEKLIT